MDWSDKRSLNEMKFGTAWKPTLADIMPQHPWDPSQFVFVPPEQPPQGYDAETAAAEALVNWKKRMSEIPTDAAIEAWQAHHKLGLDRVRSLLEQCDVEIADDIKILGCTGCVAHGLSLDDIKFLRIGLAGSGVGLPCFVPPSKFCLAHEITGGLQEGQAQMFPDQVASISRELTPEEAAHGKLVHEARWSEKERRAHEMLVGHRLPEGWEADDAKAERLGKHFDTVEVTEQNSVAIPSWKCAEHLTTRWQCRHCVAQAVVEGALEPVFVLYVDHPTGTSGMTDECVGSAIQKEIAEEEASNSNSVKLYVRVATFTRKLSRD